MHNGSAAYLYPPSSADAILGLRGCLCAGARSRGAASPARRALIDWLCQRIPSDQVQFGRTALISSPHQGSSPLPLPPPLPCILPPLGSPSDCHPLAGPDHTMESNCSPQFKLGPLFPPRLPQKAPRPSHVIWLPFIWAPACACARAHAHVIVSEQRWKNEGGGASRFRWLLF